ncbi:trimethylguanosine synthase [Drosophila obscura]|uniref:trimethylguanosine synthase n=1 Tax=Drosophila obscura TaxID=7282 RepID=UPI001BB2685D|nr:trimethylguanosine synthase [Drosophila obscura]
MHTHYLTSSRTNPQFYIFTQLFEAEHTDSSPFDLTSIQEASWLDFWQREGHQLLEEKWNKRFPEYKDIGEAGGDCDEAERVSWQALWEEHAKELSARFWHIFSCAFENYQHELLKSLSPIDTENLEEVEQELEQLELSGNQPKGKRKKNKKIDAKEPYLISNDDPEEAYLSANDDPEDMGEAWRRNLHGLPDSLGAKSKNSTQRQPRTESWFEQYSSSYYDPEDIEEEKQRKLLGLPASFGAQASNSKRRKPKTESWVEQYSSSYYDSEDIEEEEVQRNHPAQKLLASFGAQASYSTRRQSRTESWLEHDSSYYDSDLDIMTSDEEAEPLHGVRRGFIKKNKPKKKKKPNKKLVAQMPEFMLENKGKLFKYWLKRFSLFSRFDQGIRLDRESWFSVTPEKIAKQTARRLACDVILDAFCGCGGNAIQFAATCGRVIAVDIDAEKLAMAKHNARIYGVADKIEFIHADFLQFAASTKLRPDVVFFSPPWGGPSYINQATFDIERSLLPVGASHLMQLGRRLANSVGIFLPRNANMSQVIALSGVGQQCEVEHNYLDTRLVAITAYFGSGLIKNQPKLKTQTAAVGNSFL